MAATHRRDEAAQSRNVYRLGKLPKGKPPLVQDLFKLLQNNAGLRNGIFLAAVDFAYFVEPF
jgi:hypothetical protein